MESSITNNSVDDGILASSTLLFVIEDSTFNQPINSLLRRFIFIPWNFPRRFRDSSYIVDFGYISFMMSASLADLEFWKDHIFRCNTMR